MLQACSRTTSRYAILSPGQDFDGGMLEIFSDGVDQSQKSKPRVCIFPAGDYFHRVATVTRGTRRAIAFNLWAGTPTGVESGDLVVE